MRWLLVVGSIALVALAGIWAYRVNFETNAAADRVAALEAAIAAEREAIGVLRAEWAWLNRPERLARLVAAFPELGLRPMLPTDFGTVGAVAFQPPPPHPPGARAEALVAVVAPTAASGGAGAWGPWAAEVAETPAAAAGRPAAPARPVMAEAEAAPRVEGLVGAVHLALGVPLPPRRPLRVAELRP